ncbi:MULTISPECIES: LPS translocon maturation chaperone LptM [Shewanella]|jgi:predicted small lipoprotein YifL
MLILFNLGLECDYKAKPAPYALKLRKMRLYLSLLLASLLLLGCGQKGPLYKAPPAPDNQQQPAVADKPTKDDRNQ